MLEEAFWGDGQRSIFEQEARDHGRIFSKNSQTVSLLKPLKVNLIMSIPKDHCCSKLKVLPSEYVIIDYPSSSPCLFRLTFHFLSTWFSLQGNFFIVKREKKNRPTPIMIRVWWPKTVLFWTCIHKTLAFWIWSLHLCTWLLLLLLLLLCFLARLCLFLENRPWKQFLK